MKVKISDRESESKMKRWMNGEKGVFNREAVLCYVNDIDMALLRSRGVVYNEVSSFGQVYDYIEK